MAPPFIILPKNVQKTFRNYRQILSLCFASWSYALIRRRPARMRNKWFKRIFPLLAFMLLAPWPVAYAHDVSGTSAGHEPVQVTTAATTAQPAWTAFGKAIGSVKPGELFHIDASDNPADITVALCITNADELIHSYRYLILKVGVYVESGAGKWGKASGGNGEPLGETFVTLQYAQVSFTLPGLARYKVTIDGGNFYCVIANPPEGSISPRFYQVAD